MIQCEDLVKAVILLNESGVLDSDLIQIDEDELDYKELKEEFVEAVKNIPDDKDDNIPDDVVILYNSFIDGEELEIASTSPSPNSPSSKEEVMKKATASPSHKEKPEPKAKPSKAQTAKVKPVTSAKPSKAQTAKVKQEPKVKKEKAKPKEKKETLKMFLKRTVDDKYKGKPNLEQLLADDEVLTRYKRRKSWIKQDFAGFYSK